MVVFKWRWVLVWLFVTNCSVWLKHFISGGSSSIKAFFSIDFAPPIFMSICVGLVMVVWLLGLRETPETINNVAGDATIEFIRDTLKKAGYSDEQIKAVRILSGTPFKATRRTIFVPFNDEQLLRARRYYVTKDDQEGKDVASAYMRKLREQKKFDVLTDDDLMAMLQLLGKVVTRDSLPLWRGLIVHEMGHIVHKHVLKRVLFSVLGWFAVMAYYNLAAMQSSKSVVAMLFAMAMPILFIIIYTVLLGRSQEQQADEEVTKRVQDPEQLAVMGKLFELLSADSKVKNLDIKLMRLFDSHPPAIERARMFMQARDQILQMQERTSTESRRSPRTAA